MTETVLRYELDPTTGLPRLTLLSGSLGEDDHCHLEDALEQNYGRILESQRSRVLRLTLPSGPARFQVIVQTDRDSRCPTLRLRRLAPGGPRPAPAAWVEGLLHEWEGELAMAALDASDEEVGTLAEAIDQLRRLAQANPSRLAARLLAGCLSGVQDQQARRGPCPRTRPQ
jgi:hypothetical protein